MNAIAKIQEKAIGEWFEKNAWAAIRGIDEPTWSALCSTIYPGAKPDSILMAVDYCKARSLDIMLKPVHLVPMNVTDAQSGTKSWRDVPMPGIGMYRIQASRSGDEAGHDEPVFGPTVEQVFDGVDWEKKPTKVTVSYPEWCKYTVHKVVGGRVVAYTAKEFWLENYAAQSAKVDAPNAMWKKRPFAQLAKCAEAQALRKGWPEIGQQPTAEEMEGKQFEQDMGAARRSEPEVTAKSLPAITDEKWQEGLPKLQAAIQGKRKTAKEIIRTMSTKYTLTSGQEKNLADVQIIEEGEIA
jgi:phage recombination protein Bet